MSEPRVILLVDDVPQLGSIASEFLERKLSGTRVVAFTSPDEAIHWLDHGAPVDLILSDHRMGEMDGLSFLAEARARRPDAVLALMTAYLDLPVTPEDLADRGVHAIIRKPWTWVDFGRFVGELLGLPPEDRARAAEAGPRPFPPEAWQEFAAHRARGNVRQKASASGAPDEGGPGPLAPRQETGAEDERPVTTVHPTDGPEPAPREEGGSREPDAAPAHAAAGVVSCPCCEARFEVTLRLVEPSSEDAAAERLLAYLRTHPRVAKRLREKAANGTPK